jgi:hypothetical protein
VYQAGEAQAVRVQAMRQGEVQRTKINRMLCRGKKGEGRREVKRCINMKFGTRIGAATIVLTGVGEGNEQVDRAEAC